MPPIAALRARYLSGEADPITELDAALARSNANAARNTYLAQDAEWSRAQARALRREDIATQPLWGVPVSLKDCFDLAGFTTSCGSLFYRDLHGIAAEDSHIAHKLRSAGAIITGKTHLHQLAYGITGENADFGDCTQPAHPTLLTGGSSSGAAASIQEGSALAAIGTDTGGSVRTPAALCGLAGFRSSITRNPPPLWRGGYHLAPTFDTLGLLYGSLADGPLLAHALLNVPIATPLATPASIAALRIGVPAADFFHDCEPAVLATLRHWQSIFTQLGATIANFDASLWSDAFDILAPIQASEAAALHTGHFQHFEPAIAERLAWGASLTPADLARFHARLATFRTRTAALFQHFDYLLLPCAPIAALHAHADHTQTRPQILRYTAPASLCGLPTVTLPSPSSETPAGGLQLIAPLNQDATLLALSAALAGPGNKLPFTA
jgi:aspartyl-tRNA(Asn)/glutamyl-tRNA(Gln) amidotransferase subunit A